MLELYAGHVIIAQIEEKELCRSPAEGQVAEWEGKTLLQGSPAACFIPCGSARYVLFLPAPLVFFKQYFVVFVIVTLLFR